MLTEKIRLWTLLIIISIFFSDCGASRLDLSVDFFTDPNHTSGPHKGVLGVDEFIDLRPQATTSDSKKWVGFIPGVLWIDFLSEIPDTYTGFSVYNSSPFKMAFAHAIYTNIERNRVFEKIVFLPRDKYTSIDYRLEGILNQTSLKETGYYYGSSFYAWITRIMGLPYVSYEFSLDITLQLRRIDTNDIIWTYELKGSRIDKYYNVYQLTKGKEGKHIISYNFSKILEEQMPSAIESMKKTLEDIGKS